MTERVSFFVTAPMNRGASSVSTRPWKRMAFAVVSSFISPSQVDGERAGRGDRRARAGELTQVLPQRRVEAGGTDHVQPAGHLRQPGVAEVRRARENDGAPCID